MPERIKVNGYTSKYQRSIRLINGSENEGCWDLMKGGAFNLYYSQPDKQWLKVPQGGDYEYRICRSLPPQHDALELAGLNAEKDMTRIVHVYPGNTKSLLMPHLGDTIESTLKDISNHPDKDKWIDIVSEIYYYAWLQAQALLINGGWWFDDPNPGNIIRHKTKQPVLIDFSNNKIRSSANAFSQNELEKKFLKQMKKNGLRGWWD